MASPGHVKSPAGFSVRSVESTPSSSKNVEVIRALSSSATQKRSRLEISRLSQTLPAKKIKLDPSNVRCNCKTGCQQRCSCVVMGIPCKLSCRCVNCLNKENVDMPPTQIKKQLQCEVCEETFTTNRLFFSHLSFCEPPQQLSPHLEAFPDLENVDATPQEGNEDQDLFFTVGTGRDRVTLLQPFKIGDDCLLFPMLKGMNRFIEALNDPIALKAYHENVGSFFKKSMTFCESFFDNRTKNKAVYAEEVITSEIVPDDPTIRNRFWVQRLAYAGRGDEIVRKSQFIAKLIEAKIEFVELGKAHKKNSRVADVAKIFMVTIAKNLTHEQAQLCEWALLRHFDKTYMANYIEGTNPLPPDFQIGKGVNPQDVVDFTKHSHRIAGYLLCEMLQKLSDDACPSVEIKFGYQVVAGLGSAF